MTRLREPMETTYATLVVGVLAGLGFYAAVGLLFAVCFVTWGVQQIDPASTNAKWPFRVILVPGAAAFWPLLAWRWARKRPMPTEANAHRRAAAKGTSR